MVAKKAELRREAINEPKRQWNFGRRAAALPCQRSDFVLTLYGGMAGLAVLSNLSSTGINNLQILGAVCGLGPRPTHHPISLFFSTLRVVKRGLYRFCTSQRHEITGVYSRLQALGPARRELIPLRMCPE